MCLFLVLKIQLKLMEKGRKSYGTPWLKKVYGPCDEVNINIQTQVSFFVDPPSVNEHLDKIFSEVIPKVFPWIVVWIQIWFLSCSKTFNHSQINLAKPEPSFLSMKSLMLLNRNQWFNAFFVVAAETTYLFFSPKLWISAFLHNTWKEFT